MFKRSMTLMTLVLSVVVVDPASAQAPGEGLIVRKSDFGVTKTIDRLGMAVEKAGLAVFSRVKHHSGAAQAGMALRPVEVLSFGNPKVGTPLMQMNPAIGLDLPLRVVAWEEADGTTRVAYLDPDRLKARYGIAGQDETFKKIAGALRKLTDMAATKGAMPPK